MIKFELVLLLMDHNFVVICYWSILRNADCFMFFTFKIEPIILFL